MYRKEGVSSLLADVLTLLVLSQGKRASLRANGVSSALERGSERIQLLLCHARHVATFHSMFNISRFCVVSVDARVCMDKGEVFVQISVREFRG